MGASSNTLNWHYGVCTIEQDDSIFWTSGLSQLTPQAVKLVCVAVDTGIRSHHLMDFHIMRCWWAAKLATNNSFHLILKGIPDTTMKRPCSGYHGSRHTFFWPTIQCMGQSLNRVTMTIRGVKYWVWTALITWMFLCSLWAAAYIRENSPFYVDLCSLGSQGSWVARSISQFAT